MSYIYNNIDPYIEFKNKLIKLVYLYKDKEYLDYNIFIEYSNLYLYVDDKKTKDKLKKDYLSLFTQIYPFKNITDMSIIISYILDKNIIINPYLNSSCIIYQYFILNKSVKIEKYNGVYINNKFNLTFIESSSFINYKKIHNLSL